MVILLTFSAFFTVSADFRDTVVSLFRANTPEIVLDIPVDNDNIIKLAGEQSIENIAEVSYFNFKGELHSNQVISVTESDGTIQYYRLENDNMLVEISRIVTAHITDIVEFKGHTMALDFEYGTLNGKAYIENTPIDGDMEDDEDNANPKFTSANSFYDDDTVWISVHIGWQADSHEYYLLYSIKTGEVTDILAGLMPEKAHIEEILFSPDNQKLILRQFNGGWPGTNIYFDTLTKEVILLDNVYVCYFIDNETLYIEEYHNELTENMSWEDYILSWYCLNLKTGIKTNVFGTDDRVVYSSHGTAIIEKNGVYKIKTPFGYEFVVEGIDLSAGYNLYPSPDHTKIAILKFSGNSDTLGVREMGIIDLVKKEMKIFERQGQEKYYETSLFWYDNSSLIIMASGDSLSDNSFYLYRFK